MIKAIKGMNDLLPQEVERWRWVEERARQVLGLYGFSEIRTPIVEHTDLFERGLGQDTDVVEKQMYTFPDKSGSSLTLRPEATASILRAVIEHGLLSSDPIQKLYSIGPMFRYERPQKGRYRQFHQINAERIGEESPFSDAECICMAYDMCKAMGLDELSIEVNSLGCKECRPAFRAALKEFLYKSRAALCDDCKRRLETNPLRVLDCKNPSCREVVRDAPNVEEYLCDACREHYSGVLRDLDIMGVPYSKNNLLVRGLDYYTRTTFEIKAGGLGSQDAVAGGGRYDGLLKLLGGPDAPGTGFAFGLERVMMLVDAGIQKQQGCFVAAQGNPRVKEEAIRILAELRRAGIGAQAVFDKSLKAQMRRAARSGYRFCLILGEEEVNRKEVTVKDMDMSSQIRIPRDGALSRLRKAMEEGELYKGNGKA